MCRLMFYPNLLASHFGDLGKQLDPDQTSQNAASEQGLYCLHIWNFIKNKNNYCNKNKINPDKP